MQVQEYASKTQRVCEWLIKSETICAAESEQHPPFSTYPLRREVLRGEGDTLADVWITGLTGRLIRAERSRPPKHWKQNTYGEEAIRRFLPFHRADGGGMQRTVTKTRARSKSSVKPTNQVRCVSGSLVRYTRTGELTEHDWR